MENREVLPELTVEPEGLETEPCRDSQRATSSADAEDALLALFRKAALPADISWQSCANSAELRPLQRSLRPDRRADAHLQNVLRKSHNKNPESTMATGRVSTQAKARLRTVDH